MLAAEYQAYCSSLASRGIIFSYSGYVSEDLLEALGETINRKMRLDETDVSTANRVFGVFVEQVQNVIRYSAERENSRPPEDLFELSSGVITIGRENDKFFVVCGNMVMKADVPRLRTRLEQLQTLGRDELKALYKEKLRATPEPTSKGASIGLVEIARKASEPLSFDFLDVDEQHAFFFLKALI
jgi:Family of unknown function (DUF6272)